MTMGQDDEAPFGVLVGWEHIDLGDRLLVKLQSTRSREAGGEIDEFRYFMTKNQAAVLGNFLFGISGRIKPPQRKRTWFGRGVLPSARRVDEG
jgi:hypothetical protein